MRIAMGWAAAALIAAAGCGGGRELAQDQSARDPGEQPPPGVPTLEDASCGACTFDGVGPLTVGTTEVTASFAAAPLEGAPGLPAGGVAASGAMAVALHDGAGAHACGGGTVDTIWSCEIVNGVATVRFSGECHAGGRYTAEASGSELRVAHLDRCEPGDLAQPQEPACPAGQCVCGATGECEPCHDDGHGDGGHQHEAPPPLDATAPPPDGSAPPPDDGTAPPPDGGTAPPPPPPPPPFIPL